MSQPESFPRRYARTQRFTLGTPRTFRIAEDGSRVAFLRSRGSTDPVTCLWVLDVPDGIERLVADPQELGARGDETVPAAERARRERAREGASGIVGYDADADLAVAVFAVGGRLFLADLGTSEVVQIHAADDVFDPRLSPDGATISYVSGRTLRLTDRSGADRLLAAEDDPAVSWGSAEFAAGEEMGRTRGHWWGPTSDVLVVERADVSSVAEWWVGAPAEPWRPPAVMRYPAAGTPNASVALVLVSLDGSRVEIDWQRGEFEYVAEVSWAPDARPLVVAQTRDQRALAVLDVDPITGVATEIHRETDDRWVELTTGSPRRAGESLFVIGERSGSRCLVRNGIAVTPPGLDVRSLVDVRDTHAMILASEDSMETHLYRVSFDGSAVRLTTKPGVATAVGRGDAVVIQSRSMDWSGARAEVRAGTLRVTTIRSFAEDPVVVPNVEVMTLGPLELATALVLPRDHDGRALPVLMDPYAGPHAQRVVRSRDAYLVPQWFADQGFAVVVVDGRGTPGRGTEWERAVHGDLAGPTLEDQVGALQFLAADRTYLDMSRVAIRGWSFGGFLAALAVLQRPDVFHAAIAGAPVTDWRLYDTHYTERYLGHPDEDPSPYDRCDLVAAAASLQRPLLLIHGLADDNVVSAHTLRLSRALLEAGKPHQVLPLSDVSHMTPQDVVAENVLLLQLRFLTDALGVRNDHSSHR